MKQLGQLVNEQPIDLPRSTTRNPWLLDKIPQLRAGIVVSPFDCRTQCKRESHPAFTLPGRLDVTYHFSFHGNVIVVRQSIGLDETVLTPRHIALCEWPPEPFEQSARQ